MYCDYVSQSSLNVWRGRDKSVGASWERGRAKEAMEVFWYVHTLKLYPCNLLKIPGIQHKEEWRPPNSCVEDRREDDTCTCEYVSTEVVQVAGTCLLHNEVYKYYDCWCKVIPSVGLSDGIPPAVPHLAVLSNCFYCIRVTIIIEL